MCIKFVVAIDDAFGVPAAVFVAFDKLIQKDFLALGNKKSKKVKIKFIKKKPASSSRWPRRKNNCNPNLRTDSPLKMNLNL